MTPLLTSPLLVVFTCLFICAQEPGPPLPKVLVGTWRESPRAGEDERDRLGILCRGNKITIELNGQRLQGTFETSPDSSPATVIITVLVVNGRALEEKRAYAGAYCLDGGTLFLRIAPRRVATGATAAELPRIDLEKYKGLSNEQLEKLQSFLMAEVDKARIEVEKARLGRGMDLAPVTFRLERVKK